MKTHRLAIILCLLCALALAPGSLSAGAARAERSGTRTEAGKERSGKGTGGEKRGERKGGRSGEAEEDEALVPEFVAQPEAVHWQLEGSGYDAPAFSVTARLPEAVVASGLRFQWYVCGVPAGEAQVVPANGGREASSAFLAQTLLDRPCGVYPVWCVAEADVAEARAAQSYTVNFIVCRGVQPNSLVTFSDVHQVWDNIGAAISDTIIATGGFIPALVIATGDYNNGYVAGWDEARIGTCIDTMIRRMQLQLGGIDTVWVSGNHDNGYATGFTNANREAGLGMVEADYYDVERGISGTGIIFDTRSADYAANAGTSAAIEGETGLIVIGVNYEDIGAGGAYEGSTDGRPTYSEKLDYGAAGSAGTVYAHLERALERVAADYHGELVVISTHAGLHALGVDPDSLASGAKPWSGNADYSISHSTDIVALINRYADAYGMDILFLFGHNHSKQEAEFLKVPGDRIVSTRDFASRTTEALTLSFTYAHAGYLTDSIGGSERYTWLTWDADSVVRSVKRADGSAADGAAGANLVPGLSVTLPRCRMPGEAFRGTSALPEAG